MSYLQLQLENKVRCWPEPSNLDLGREGLVYCVQTLLRMLHIRAEHGWVKEGLLPRTLLLEDRSRRKSNRFR